MIRLCNWTFETKVIVVCDSLYRKPISIVYCISLLNNHLLKPVVGIGWCLDPKTLVGQNMSLRLPPPPAIKALASQLCEIFTQEIFSYSISKIRVKMDLPQKCKEQNQSFLCHAHKNTSQPIYCPYLILPTAWYICFTFV